MKLEELENAMDEEDTRVWFVWGKIRGLVGVFVGRDAEDEAMEAEADLSDLPPKYRRDVHVYETHLWVGGRWVIQDQWANKWKGHKFDTATEAIQAFTEEW